MLSEEFWARERGKAHPLGGPSERVYGWRIGWNACRAAVEEELRRQEEDKEDPEETEGEALWEKVERMDRLVEVLKLRGDVLAKRVEALEQRPPMWSPPWPWWPTTAPDLNPTCSPPVITWREDTSTGKPGQ